MPTEIDPMGLGLRAAVARQLKWLRVTAGLTGPQLAGRLGWSHAKVSRIENARQRVSVPDVNAWANATGAAEDLREKLVGMTATATVRGAT